MALGEILTLFIPLRILADTESPWRRGKAQLSADPLFNELVLICRKGKRDRSLIAQASYVRKIELFEKGKVRTKLHMTLVYLPPTEP